MTKILTGEVRFSYVHVFKPHANEEGQTPKYSVSILIPKKDKKTISKIENEVERLLEEHKATTFKGVPKSKLKTALRDGDEEKPDDAEYAGHMFMTLSSVKQAPGVIDENKDEIMDSRDFYSGCYGRALFNFFVFNKSGNAGVAAGLIAVQKLRDGEPLGGSSWSADDFGDDDDIM